MTMRAQMLSGLKWTAGARFSGQLVTWAITLVVMRLLSPADYGLLAMATVWIAFLLMLAEAGLWPAMIQKSELGAAELSQAYGIVIAINIGLLLLINLCSPIIAGFFRDHRLVAILQVLSLQFPLMALTVVPSSLLNRKLRFRELSLVNLGAAVSSSLVTLVLAILHFEVWALVLGSLFSGCVKALALNLLERVHVRPRLSLEGMRRLLHFGGMVTGSRLLWFFFTQVDVLIVGRVLGKEMLGLYSVAMQVASLPVQRVSAILNQVAFPVIARFQDDHGAVASFVSRGARALSLVAFPVLWGISSVSSELVEVVLGQRWHDAAIPLRLLALMMPLRMLVNLLPSATDALGHPELGFQNALLASLVMPVSFLVGCHWGIVGVAIAWVTAYPVVLLFNTGRMLKVMNLRLRDVGVVIAPSATCAALMYVAVAVVGRATTGIAGDVARLATMVATGVVVYGALTVAFNRRGYRDVLMVLRTS